MSRRKREEDSRTVHQRQQDFLRAYGDCFSVARAAEKAHIDRGTHFRWLRKDAKYVASFERRKQTVGNYLEVDFLRPGGHLNRQLKRVSHFRGISSF